MAKDRNTQAKRLREQEKKRKADQKRVLRAKKKQELNDMADAKRRELPSVDLVELNKHLSYILSTNGLTERVETSVLMEAIPL